MNRTALRCAMALALATALNPASAADTSQMPQAQSDYQLERARCARGESGQALETCLKEAGAAYEEARRGHPDSAPAADLARNATQRCTAQPVEDREACVQRILGAGNAEGSVGGGGLIRRSETKVP